MKHVRILLADDHQMIRESLSSLINAETNLVVVGEADNGRTALEQIETLRPDLVLLDISMPEMGGIQVMEQLRGREDAPRVIVLTAYADATYLCQLLDAGAAGYVLKRSPIGVLVEAIRSVMAGDTYLDPRVAGKVVSGFLAQKKLRGLREGDVLSERENQVLLRVAQGYSNREIAGQLGISVKTVESHKANSVAKLGIRSRAEIVRYALDQGWLADA
ncbi:MAG: response regulator transcription factor [Deltaproteobacteria bacterium]|nr:response regulator transcription factor [Deltaproteobacteria bacterium]